MLNDSWEMVAILDRTQGFARLSPSRNLMHDLFSLALTVGGIVLILFSESGPSYEFNDRRRSDGPDVSYSKNAMVRTALYLLAAVV